MILLFAIWAVVAPGCEPATPLEFPAQQPGDRFAVFLTGDGGWRPVDRAITKTLNANGVSVVGTESLSSSAVWKADNREFDALALTPDGERLYAVSNASGVISIISTRDGSRLGELKIPAFGQAILRIDPSR